MLHSVSKPRTIYHELLGFGIILLFCILDDMCPVEISRVQHALIEAIVIIGVATPIIIKTKRTSSKLYRLEGFLSLCAWCKKIKVNNEGIEGWQTIEELTVSEHNIKASHGICPECINKLKEKT